ncbi:Hypothetical protein GLP15_4030 [Giardia lamblia P15]|uniref:Uncharacterized protein n=1 Tax=Giardia intestinalis (strain P15) TaxID=658858 RepID=E1F5E6_GIAIA|nr:Hypothetical protein GLP15_4030 [Giardia lamblia P15]
MQDSVSELLQSNASSKESEPPGNSYRNPALTQGGDTKAQGYHEAKHNNLLNEVRSQLSDLRDLLSSSKGSEFHEASAESSDLRITDEQLAHMAPGERALFLQRLPDLQNELFSEGISSSISVGDTVDGAFSSKRFQPPTSTTRQAMPTPIATNAAKTAQADAPPLQTSKGAPPRVARLQTGTPNQSQLGKGYTSSTSVRTPAGSSFAIGDDSRRSAIEQPRVVSIQRANLEVDNATSIPHDIEASVESDFSTSDITDVIEANVVLPPRLPQPVPAVNQRSTSSKRAKTPNEPRTVIQRVKPELDDIVLPPPESNAPYDSEVDPDEYDATLTIHRRPQSAGGGLSGGNKDSSYNSTYARSSFQAQKPNASFGSQNRLDDSDHSDLNILSSNATLLYTKQPRATVRGTSTAIYNKNVTAPLNQDYTNESHNTGVMPEANRSNVLRSNAERGSLRSPHDERQNTRTRSARQQNNSSPSSFDDDIINNVHAAASNFIKLPKQSKQALTLPEDSEPMLADIMTIPESTVLYNPRQHSAFGKRSVDAGDRSFAGRKPRGSMSGMIDDGTSHEHYDDTCEHTNVLSIQREPLLRSKPQKDVGKDIDNPSRHANASMPSNSGYYGGDISVEDDIQETKLFISAADAGRSRLVSDKSIGEKKHKRQHQGPNHTIITQLAQYETKSREQMMQHESDEDHSSSDPEVTISKLVYPKLTPAEQEKLRRLAEMRSKQPKAHVPDVHVYGRPKSNELELEDVDPLKQKDTALAIVSTNNADDSYLYSNVTPYYQYKRQLTKSISQGFAKAKDMKNSVSDDTPAQEVTQFVNSKYVEMARAVGMTDPSLLQGDVAKSYIKGAPLSSALHIRSDMTLGDIARSGRKFVVARKEEATPADLSRATATGRDGYTQKDDSSDSEPQYEDMTILPAAEPYYGLPQPDFESFNHSIQSMRQSLLMRSSNTQSASLTENQLDDRITRAKEAIRAAERQNGLSPSVLTTGSLSTNWAQAASPTTYMPQVISPAAHPRIRPTSRSHPPVPEPPLPGSLPEGGQVSQATIQRMNAMSDMVMPDRTTSASSTSSGASGTLMQQLQKYGTIDPKVGVQSASGIPRSNKAQVTPRTPGAASQNSRGSRPGQPQPSGRPGSMSGPRPSKRMYLQAPTQDPGNVTEAVALAEYILAQNQVSVDGSDCTSNILAVLSDLELPSNQKLGDLRDVPNSIRELSVSHDYKLNASFQTCCQQSIEASSLSRPLSKPPSSECPYLYCTTDYHLCNATNTPDVISNCNATIDIIAHDAPLVHNVQHDIILDCPSSSNEPPSNRSNSIMKLDLTLPSISIQLQPSALENEETSFTSSSDTDVEFAAPEYMLRSPMPTKIMPHTLVAGTLSWKPDCLSYALRECHPRTRPLLLETQVNAIWNFSNDTFSDTLINDSDSIIEAWPAPDFFLADLRVKHMQTVPVITQSKKSNLDSLIQNRRSSLQYYKNAQLLLYGFIPDESKGVSVLQSWQQNIDLTNSIASLVASGLLQEEKNTVNIHNCEQTSIKRETDQLTSQTFRSKDSFLEDIHRLPNNSPASYLQSDNLTSSYIQLDLSTSNNESVDVEILTTTSIMHNLAKSISRPIVADSNEVDISLVETLRPPVEIETQFAHPFELSKELTLQQGTLNGTGTNLPKEEICVTTTEMHIPQVMDQSYRKDSVRKPTLTMPFAVPTVPLYTINPIKAEVTRHLYGHPYWQFSNDSLIFEAPKQYANREFAIQNYTNQSDDILEASLEVGLTFKYVQQSLDSVCLNVESAAADPYFLFRQPIAAYNVAREYVTKEIHRTCTDEIITAIPIYSVNKTRAHTIRLTSEQRDLVAAGEKNITYLTRALDAEFVKHDDDQQCFEIDLPFIKRAVPNYPHAILDNLYSDAIAMHDVIVKTQPSKTKIYEANDSNYSITRALSKLELTYDNFNTCNLTRSKSAYVELLRPFSTKKVINSRVDYPKNVDRTSIRSASVSRSYTHNSDYPNIRVTRLGNRDLKFSDAITPVSTLDTQKSYVLKALGDVDEVCPEIVVPKRACHKDSTPPIKQHMLDKYNRIVSQPATHLLKETSPQEGCAMPLYTLDCQSTPIEQLVTCTTPANDQQSDKYNCTTSMYKGCIGIDNCIIENESIVSDLRSLRTHSELILSENQKPSGTSYFDPVDKNDIQAYVHVTRQDNVISSDPVKLRIKQPFEEVHETSSSALVAKPHTWTGPIFKPPTHAQKSGTSLTEASADNSYTSFLSIEGPSLPLRFDFSKPDYTVSMATLDETFENTHSGKASAMLKYTNFDTPSVIPSTLVANEMTFQTPEAMAEGVSTNLLLYPQQTLQLREPLAESESGNAEPAIKANLLSNPIESEAQQLYTQSKFYIKKTTSPLNESVIAQECKKTDFVRSYVRIRSAHQKIIEDEEPVPLSVATRHGKQHTVKTFTSTGQNSRPVLSQPSSNVGINSVPLSASTSSSVSELLGHINTAIALSKDTIARTASLQDKPPALTVAFSEPVTEPLTSLEHGLHQPSQEQQQQQSGSLPCANRQDCVTKSLVDVERNHSVLELKDVKQSASTIQLEHQINTKAITNASIESVAVPNSGAALLPPLPQSYKAVVIDRAVETTGPYLLKKTTVEKNTLAKEVAYSLRRLPPNSSNKPSSSSTHIIQDEPVVDASPSSEPSSPKRDCKYNHLSLGNADSSYQYHPSKMRPITGHSNSITCPSLTVDVPNDSYLPKNASNVQQKPDACPEGLSAILQALQSLVDISKNNMLFVQTCNDSQKHAIDPLLWQEYIKQLEFLTTSIKLSSETILDLKIAFQTLNDKLIDKLTSDIKSNLLATSQASPTVTSSKKENTPSLPSVVSTPEKYRSTLTVGTQAKLDYQSVPYAPVDRLEELQRLYRELSASKDIVDKYAHILNSPADATDPTNHVSSVSTPRNIDEPSHFARTILEPDTNELNDYKLASKEKLDDAPNHFMWYEPMQNTKPLERATPKSQSPPSRSQFTTSDHFPLKPKREICLPVMSTSLIAKIKKEAKRRREISEDALTRSHTLGPYLRQITYTESSIANHVAFAIFNDIMDAITTECVESIKQLMGL